jgi:hypothetical protein
MISRFTSWCRKQSQSPFPESESSGSSRSARTESSRSSSNSPSGLPEAMKPYSPSKRDMEDALGAYLMARAALHRKIDDTPDIEWKWDGQMEKQTDGLKRLRAANDTVAETHALLPHGRGNVKEDNRRTGYESSLRETSYREFFNAIPLTLAQNDHQALAGAFRFVKAARCAGSAAIATHLHARKLEDLYRVVIHEKLQADHTWSEVRWKGLPRHNDVLIDRWCDGPAVLREDARYGYTPGKVIFQLDKTTGSESAKTVDKIAAHLEADPKHQARVKKILTGLKNDRREEGEFDAQRVFSPEFEKAAGKALHGTSGRPHLTQEIQAVGVALSLNGGPDLSSLVGGHSASSSTSGKVRESLAKAPGIIESAKSWFPPQDR